MSYDAETGVLTWSFPQAYTALYGTARQLWGYVNNVTIKCVYYA